MKRIVKVLKAMSDSASSEMEEETSSDEGEVVENPEGEEVVSAEEAADREGLEKTVIERLQTEAEANYDKYLRSVAEFENYKKRALRERADFLRYAGEHIARDMLQIHDDLHLALKSSEQGKGESLTQGLKMVVDKLGAIFQQHGIKSESAVGKPFDPAKHEALASQPTSESAAGTVLEEWRPAFFFKDKLLRPAQVVVAAEEKPKEGAEQANTSSDGQTPEEE